MISMQIAFERREILRKFRGVQPPPDETDLRGRMASERRAWMSGCASLASILHSPDNLAPGSSRRAHAQLEDLTYPDLENIWRTALPRVCKGSECWSSLPLTGRILGSPGEWFRKDCYHGKWGPDYPHSPQQAAPVYSPASEVTRPFPAQGGSGGLPPGSSCLQGVTGGPQPFHLWNVENPACLEAVLQIHLAYS